MDRECLEAATTAAKFANAIMTVVANTLGTRLRGHEDRACEIMRQECKGLFNIGPRAWAHADVREALLGHQISESWVITAVAASCIERIINEVLKGVVPTTTPERGCECTEECQ